MPLGKLTQNTEPYGFQPPKQQENVFGFYQTMRSFSFNEYIVYKEDQVALRYIVQYRSFV